MTTSAACIFSRIAQGRAPAHVVWSDAEHVAFLDASPITAGHLLLIPREHLPWVDELSAEAHARLFARVRALAHVGSVLALFVRPEAEGRGYGRALLAAAEAWLFAEGWTTIWLRTGREPYLRAHRIYRAAGWRLVGPAAHGDVRYEKHRDDRDAPG